MEKKAGASSKLYGVVGPIVGVTGLLLGLASKRNMQGAALLAETLGHPMYLGMEGAKELLKALEKRFSLGIDIKGFDQEIKQMETEMRKKAREIEDVQLTAKSRKRGEQETTYIG